MELEVLGTQASWGPLTLVSGVALSESWQLHGLTQTSCPRQLGSPPHGIDSSLPSGSLLMSKSPSKVFAWCWIWWDLSKTGLICPGNAHCRSLLVLRMLKGLLDSQSSCFANFERLTDTVTRHQNSFLISAQFLIKIAWAEWAVWFPHPFAETHNTFIGKQENTMKKEKKVLSPLSLHLLSARNPCSNSQIMSARTFKTCGNLHTDY